MPAEPDAPDGAFDGLLDDSAESHRRAFEDPRLKEALRRLDRLNGEFFKALILTEVYASRDSRAYHDVMVFRWAPTYNESVVAAQMLAEKTLLRPTARELRHLVETLVKLLLVDQTHPKAPLTERMTAFDGLHPAGLKPRDAEHLVDALHLEGLGGEEANFKAAIKSMYGEMSGYVHPSDRQFDSWERREGERGMVDDTLAIIRLLEQTYEFTLVMLFHGIGLGLARDVIHAVTEKGGNRILAKGRFLPVLVRHLG